MEKIYGVTNFVMDSGERYCMVVDRTSGLPEYYPNLFLTTQIRNRGDAFSKMLAAASNLVVLLRFVDSRGINLEQLFLSKDFFKLYELDNLLLLPIKRRKRRSKVGDSKIRVQLV